jgi:hypothetical protein
VTTQAHSANIADVTTPDPQETPIQRFRVPLDAWLAFGAMCRRLSVPRARRLFDLMWNDVRRHGTDEEKSTFAAADKTLKARRSRKRDGE